MLSENRGYRVAITGASGYIGSSLGNYLESCALDVYGVYRKVNPSMLRKTLIINLQKSLN